jgi:hypothetical protein
MRTPVESALSLCIVISLVAFALTRKSRLRKFQKNIRIFWAGRIEESWYSNSDLNLFENLDQIDGFDNIPLSDYRALTRGAAFIGLTAILDKVLGDYSNFSRFNFKCAVVDHAPIVEKYTIGEVIFLHKVSMETSNFGITNDVDAMNAARKLFAEHPKSCF